MGCGWDGGMMEWLSSITEIIRDCGLSVTLSKTLGGSFSYKLSAHRWVWTRPQINTEAGIGSSDKGRPSMGFLVQQKLMQLYSSVSFYSLSVVRLLPCFSPPLPSLFCVPHFRGFSGAWSGAWLCWSVCTAESATHWPCVCVCPSLQFTNFTAN